MGSGMRSTHAPAILNSVPPSPDSQRDTAAPGGKRHGGPEAFGDGEVTPGNHLRTILDRRPFGLFVDVDGTISDLAPTPREAFVAPRARTLLQALASKVHVAVVSGRTLVDLRRMVGLGGITYVGSHGLATWVNGREEHDGAVKPYVRYAQQAMVELAPLRRLDGILFEEKSTGLAIHYRLTRDADRARADILRAIAASGSAAHFDVLEGIKVVELRPRLGINKGTSVRSLANRFRLEGLVYVGDDLTDIDAFQAARDLRRGGRIDTMAVAVRHRHTPPLIEAAADYVVEGVAGVEQLLAYAARRAGAEVAPDATAASSASLAQKASEQG